MAGLKSCYETPLVSFACASSLLPLLLFPEAPGHQMVLTCRDMRVAHDKSFIINNAQLVHLGQSVVYRRRPRPVIPWSQGTYDTVRWPNGPARSCGPGPTSPAEGWVETPYIWEPAAGYPPDIQTCRPICSTGERPRWSILGQCLAVCFLGVFVSFCFIISPAPTSLTMDKISRSCSHTG